MVRKRSSKYLQTLKKYEPLKIYSVDEALGLVSELGYAKFDESVDLAFLLGVDPRHADQMIRGAVVMPAGMGKSLRIAVITSGEKIGEAESAGADFVGSDDLIQKIQGGWLDFDRVIATPEMMGKVGRIGRVLGPRGLMPNPKLGTVTTDVVKAINEQKAGKVEYRTEKTGIIHVPIGKRSFGKEKLLENFKVLSHAIVRAKPASSKGVYLKSVIMSTTMGPGIRVDTNDVITVSGN